MSQSNPSGQLQSLTNPVRWHTYALLFRTCTFWSQHVNDCMQSPMTHAVIIEYYWVLLALTWNKLTGRASGCSCAISLLGRSSFLSFHIFLQQNIGLLSYKNLWGTAWIHLLMGWKVFLMDSKSSRYEHGADLPRES